MYILKKDGSAIYNLEKAETVCISSSGIIIKFVSGSSSNLGKYDSGEDCKTALEIILDAINLGRSNGIRCPSDAQVKTRRLQTEPVRNRHISGKKTKGHGGS